MDSWWHTDQGRWQRSLVLLGLIDCARVKGVCIGTSMRVLCITNQALALYHASVVNLMAVHF